MEWLSLPRELRARALGFLAPGDLFAAGGASHWQFSECAQVELDRAWSGALGALLTRADGATCLRRVMLASRELLTWFMRRASARRPSTDPVRAAFMRIVPRTVSTAAYCYWLSCEAGVVVVPRGDSGFTVHDGPWTHEVDVGFDLYLSAICRSGAFVVVSDRGRPARAHLVSTNSGGAAETRGCFVPGTDLLHEDARFTNVMTGRSFELPGWSMCGNERWLAMTHEGRVRVHCAVTGALAHTLAAPPPGSRVADEWCFHGRIYDDCMVLNGSISGDYWTAPFDGGPWAAWARSSFRGFNRAQLGARPDTYVLCDIMEDRQSEQLLVLRGGRALRLPSGTKSRAVHEGRLLFHCHTGLYELKL